MSETNTSSRGVTIGRYEAPDDGSPWPLRYTVQVDGQSIDLDVWQAESLAHDLLLAVNEPEMLDWEVPE